MRPFAPMVLALALVPAALVPRADAPQVVTTERLGGEARPLVHVSTDKPIYRGGETAYVRGVVLEARSRRPVAVLAWVTCEILGPKGDVVHQGPASGSEGVLAFNWSIPEGQPGGLYTVRFPGAGMAPAERTIEVRAFRAPRIKTQIVFLRDGYGPGDDVTAALEATRAEGGAPAGAALTLVAMVDGREITRQPAGVLDAAGRATLRFRLPESIERGDGTLAVVIEDGGLVETASRTIPILLRSVDLAAFPEGGDLVAGLSTRVYVEARLTTGKPADVAGVVEDASGDVVARFRTEHEGRGRVRFVPAKGGSYRIRITEPAGISTIVQLPEVSSGRGLVTSMDDVTPAGAPLRLRVGAMRSGAHAISVSSRETEIARAEAKLDRGELRRVVIDLPDEASGVLRVTLLDPDGTPVSERLVFRSPADEVLVEMSCDRPRYVPAGQVELRIRTTRADGTPVPAMVGVSVSDDTVRELLETRDQPPQLPVQVFLEPEVRELADAAVYLDPDDERAPLAVDLLLGTQGWRRFAFAGDPTALVAEHGDAARRVLALPGDLSTDTSIESGMAGILGAAAKVEGLLFDHAMPPPAAMPAPAVAFAEELEKDDVQAVAEPAPGARADMAAEMAWNIAAQVVEKKRLVARDRDERRRQEMRAPVRVYAHAARAGRVPGDRRDFTDTVYWNAGLRTDEKGEARVVFALSDAVTSFRVLCDAFTTDGTLGAGSRLIDSVEPFYLEPKLPLEISSGDVVRLPITAVNGTLDRFDSVALDVTATGPLTHGRPQPFALPAGDRVRVLVPLVAGDGSGSASLEIRGSGAGHADTVTRTLRVAPLGFPASRSFGGMLHAGDRVVHELLVPDDVVKGSVRTSAQVFPTSLGKLTGALERLIQEPSGCFEQTSSTTYPLVMAQQYFMSHASVDPALITRSHEMLGKGYERLTSFECTTRGYEWFGESPGHEALTAFGLLELTDMSRVREVDADMLARTREWLLATRDGKGGFKRERRALHQWIEDVDASNAYILWALIEAGEPATRLGVEIDALARAARTSDNAYVHALAANVMQVAGRRDDAVKLTAALAERQDDAGRLAGATASIVGSTGEALDIEATALAALAWLRSPAHQAHADAAIRWLAEGCQGGRYGSTQATVLALRAIVAHDDARARPRAGGRLVLSVDDRAIGEAIEFEETTDGVLTFSDFGAALGPGPHRIEIAMEGGGEMPYALEISLHRRTPESSPDCPLEIAVSLSGESLVEGQLAEATMILRSRSAEPLPMAVAVVGIPGGLEPRHEQLKELVRSRSVAAYEVIGRQIVLYFRTLEARAEKRIPLSLVAAVPGSYTGPASRAYLYYGDEHVAWTGGLRAEIEAR